MRRNLQLHPKCRSTTHHICDHVHYRQTEMVVRRLTEKMMNGLFFFEHTREALISESTHPPDRHAMRGRYIDLDFTTPRHACKLWCKLHRHVCGDDTRCFCCTKLPRSSELRIIRHRTNDCKQLVLLHTPPPTLAPSKRVCIFRWLGSLAASTAGGMTDKWLLKLLQCGVSARCCGARTTRNQSQTHLGPSSDTYTCRRAIQHSQHSELRARTAVTC